jgi:hypothetical protein
MVVFPSVTEGAGIWRAGNAPVMTDQGGVSS